MLQLGLDERGSAPAVSSRGRASRRVAFWLWAAGLVSASLGAAAPGFADLPPLVPRTTYFSNSEHDWPQVSPGGTRLAWLAPSKEGVQNVWIRTLGKNDDVMVTQDSRQGIFTFAWAWDDHHLLYVQDRDGDEQLHLWSVDLETKAVRDLTPFAGARAQGLMLSAARPNEALIGLNIRDPRVFDQYRIDLESGSCVMDTQNPGDILGWTTDANLQIRAACAFSLEDGHTTLRVRDATNAPWRDLIVLQFAETPLLGQTNGGSLILGFTPDGRALDVVTYGNSETTRVVRLDAATGAEKQMLATDPKCDVAGRFDDDRVMRYQSLRNPVTGALQAVAFEEAKLEWRVIDPSVAADFEFLRKAAAPGCFTVNSRDKSDRRWIVLTYADNGPTSYSLYDRDRKTLEHLFDDFPALRDLKLASVEPVRIKARDGMSLLAYQTLPVGVPAKNLPLVLYVHGGPWARDHWGYDPFAQWLANRGYAVLQVQFRGSMGLGKKYLNAGNGQWGKGSMQNDLTDAVRWAISKGVADPKRVCILGGSYGGYATLAGLAFTPELYACGVDIVGPSNVATAMASFPPYWAPVKKRWILRVGDPENDAALNERISPLFHVDAIRAPLIIGHGANDPRVKLAESEKIVAALRERNQTVSFVVYPDEGHGFGRPENNLDFCGRVEEFLAAHLGGRAEPRQDVEGSSAAIR